MFFPLSWALPSAQAAAAGCHHRPAHTGAGSPSPCPARSGAAPYRGPLQPPQPAGALHSSPPPCGFVLSASPRQGKCCFLYASFGKVIASRGAVGIWGEKAHWTLSRLVLDV